MEPRFAKVHLSSFVQGEAFFFFFPKCIGLPTLVFKGMLVPGHGNESAGTHRGSSLGQGMRQDNQGYPGVVPVIKLNKGCESFMNRLVQGSRFSGALKGVGASEALSGLGRLCGGARRVGKHSRVHSRRKRTPEGPGVKETM